LLQQNHVNTVLRR